jgi:hypothetical protein
VATTKPFLLFQKTFFASNSAALRLSSFLLFSVAFVILLGSLNSALAQTNGKLPDFYKEPGMQPNRDYVNQHFGEHIDPFTGALQLHYVDVHVPGNGGFDLN